MHTLVKKYTVSTIFACAFGIDMDAFQEKENETLSTIDRLTLIPNVVLELEMMFSGLLGKMKISLFPATITNFFYTLVSNVISQRDGNMISNNIKFATDGTSKRFEIFSWK